MVIVSKKGSTVHINGRGYTGHRIEIVNGAIVVDGVAYDDELPGEIHVSIAGDVESVEIGAGSVTARDIGNVKTMSGDVRCERVSGDVRTMSGDVKTNSLGGNARTMSGDVHTRQA